MSVGKRDYFLRLQTLLVFLILNGVAKTKLAILPFLCCGEIVKNSNESVSVWLKTVSHPAYQIRIYQICRIISILMSFEVAISHIHWTYFIVKAANDKFLWIIMIITDDSSMILQFALRISRYLGRVFTKVSFVWTMLKICYN